MAPSMIALTTVPSGPSGVRRVRISLPLVPCLIDDARYFLPDTLPPPAGEDLRSLYRPRPGKVLGQDVRLDKPPRRGALWTSHDNSRLIQKRLT
jgi:hypothetical protein